MSKEIAREIVNEGNTQKLNYTITNLAQPEIEFDSIKLIYEISLIKPDMLVDYFDEIASCLNSNNSKTQEFTLLIFANLAYKKWSAVWDCRDKICDQITAGDISVLESGLLLFIEMAKYSDEEMKIEASQCVSAVLEILPIENLQKFTKVITDSDIMFKGKNLILINKRLAQSN